MIKPLEWIRAIISTCDNPDGFIILYRKGVEVCDIQPQTKDYLDLKYIVHGFEWENYPKPSGYEYDDENENPYYSLWYGDIVIEFDSFKVYWL